MTAPLAGALVVLHCDTGAVQATLPVPAHLRTVNMPQLNADARLPWREPT